MKQQAAQLHSELSAKVASVLLSQTLPLFIRSARELEDKSAEKWARLEFEGYFKDNSALTDDDVVPEYRTVAGQYHDTYGRPFLVRNPRLHFINEYRLRHGVDELEKMASKSEPISIQDPKFIGMIQEKFQVAVHVFTFSPIAVSGILASIRSRLADKLYEMRLAYADTITPSEIRNR